MTTIGLLITAIIAAMCSGVAYDIIGYCIEQHKKKDYEKLDKHEDHIISGYHGNVNEYSYSGTSNMNKQIVYKVNGDFNGDIKGDNVTVILMGNGDFNGNISSKDGEVVLLNGNIRGDVKANNVLCPTEPKQVKCSNCVHARFISLNGNRECNLFSQFGVKVNDNYHNCQLYKPIKHKENNLASPYERIDFTYDGDKCVNRYKSLALANVTCPHCRKSFLKNLKVLTTVVDGEVSNTEIQNYDGYILG